MPLLPRIVRAPALRHANAMQFNSFAKRQRQREKLKETFGGVIGKYKRVQKDFHFWLRQAAPSVNEEENWYGRNATIQETTKLVHEVVKAYPTVDASLRSELPDIVANIYAAVDMRDKTYEAHRDKDCNEVTDGHAYYAQRLKGWAGQLERAHRADR
jgi:hypothetical protein